MCPDAPELRVLLEGMDMPLLWMPSHNDPGDEKRGGLVEAFHRENGREIEIVEFKRTHGWVMRSELTAPGEQEDFDRLLNLLFSFFRANSSRAEKR